MGAHIIWDSSSLGDVVLFEESEDPISCLGFRGIGEPGMDIGKLGEQSINEVILLGKPDDVHHSR